MMTLVSFADLKKSDLPMSAASGIVQFQDRLFIISDSDAALYECDKTGKLITVHPIPWDELPEDPVARKKKKPDFESITLIPNGVLVFPSFSSANRMRAVHFKINKEGHLVTPPEMIGLTDLGPRLAKYVPALNIEGAIFLNGKLQLFQRGNGKKNLNGVFEIKVSQKDLLAGNKIKKWPIKFKKIELGEGFTTTDAIDLGSKGVLISACIEDTKNTYDDGEILGAGLFLYKAGKVKKLTHFDKGIKIEGISGTMNFKTHQLSLLMVDDPDDHKKTSGLYFFLISL